MTLRASVESAVGQMPWLQESDRATVDLALEYAGAIDDAEDKGKALFLGPHLLNALRALGGAPADRKALGVEEEAKGKLAHLRAVHEKSKKAG